MIKFFKDIKKYFNYIIFSVKSELKSEVANSHFSVLWWVLDPLFFMMVYTFVVKVVFDRGGPNFPVFVFIGLSAWNFFNKVLTTSVKLVSANKAVVSKVYLPKYVLLIEKIGVHFFKMMISFSLVFVMLIIYKIPYTFMMLHGIILLGFLILITFAISIFFLHFGIYVEDLANVLKPTLRLLFYMSGILYSINDRIPKEYAWVLLKLNPIALIVNEFRNVIMYNTLPDYKLLAVWTLVAIILSVIGIHLVQKNENNYVKVI